MCGADCGIVARRDGSRTTPCAPRRDLLGEEAVSQRHRSGGSLGPHFRATLFLKHGLIDTPAELLVQSVPWGVHPVELQGEQGGRSIHIDFLRDYFVLRISLVYMSPYPITVYSATVLYNIV